MEAGNTMTDDLVARVREIAEREAAFAEETRAIVVRALEKGPTFAAFAAAQEEGARIAEVDGATLRDAAARLAAVSRVADWCDDEARRLKGSATAYTSPYGDDLAEAKGEGIAEAGKRIREALEGEGDE
jgi:type IV secretory pathway VirJ component